MDYLAYWGLKKAPFALTPDPEMLYMSTQHSECIMRLKYSIFSQKGGALLVSDTAGNGKTSVLARLKNDLDDYYGGRVRVVFIDHPTLTPIEMIGEIAHQLGSELHTTEKIRALNYLRDRLFALYNEDIKVVVIVDEGQMLKERPDILGELRILLNFCVTDAFLLTFIFSGQKPLDDVLRAMPEFWQRLPVRFFLKNLDYNDTCGLVKHRLEKVGGSGDIFTGDAFEGIYKYSEGCPRVICSVADLCLVIGYAKGAKRIGFAEVTTACRDMESSGDGFHYYTYVKAQDAKGARDPAPEAASRRTAETPPERQPAPAAPPSPVASAGSIVSCPACAESNARAERFCSACGSPLYRKCPVCRSLVDTFTGECSRCGADIDAELRHLFDESLAALTGYAILEDGERVWLQAKNIALRDDERILIILPRGNFITPGPSCHVSGKNASGSKKACDLVVTDRRILLAAEGEPHSFDLLRIETCKVSDTGRFFGSRYVMMFGAGGVLYSVMLPYSTAKNKAIFTTISSYIHSCMLY